MTTPTISKPGSSAPEVRTFSIWPRKRSTAGALVALILVQVTLFIAVTQRSFFFLDDYSYFKLAQERHFLRYLFTPILGVYLAPGDRLLSFLLQKIAPLNFTVARMILLVFLAGTTIFLWQLVRTLAASDHWWTVALVVPFALSITLVIPVGWWSAGLPIIPALFFTVVAISAWLRSYSDPNPIPWMWVAVLAVASAGAFYLKFLLIPVYLLLLRLVILPRVLNVSAGIRGLWKERMRWLALAVPPVAYLAVYVISGIASRSASGGSRPFVEYFSVAWFRVFVPSSLMNVRLDESSSTLTSWLVVVSSQLVFWGMVAATCRRSRLAVRGWALLVLVFLLNAGVVGFDRLPFFGVNIAYALRYYPEITLFLPLVLALGLRQGAERRPERAWERKGPGQAAIALLAILYVVSFGIWAPGTMSAYQGVRTRPWYENLRRDLDAVTVDGTTPRIVDSETPEYVMESWMEPLNRVSTILSLVPLEVVYNQLSARTYLVRDDGHLAEAVFRPISLLVSSTTLAEGVRIEGRGGPASGGTCVKDRGRLAFTSPASLTGKHLAIRIFYSGRNGARAALHVDTDDPNRPSRDLELRPFQSSAELIDLATSGVRSLTLKPSPNDHFCIQRLEIGSLTARGS